MQSKIALAISAALLASAGALTPALAAPVVAPTGSIGIQLLDAPTSARADPRGHMYIVDQLHNGSVITRHVRVRNSTNKPAAVSLYAAAASISGGTFGFAAGTTANDLTSWTTLTPHATTLAPGRAMDATVRIAVPVHVTSGERYAVVWAQVASAAAPGTTREINRAGVRMYIDIAGNVESSNFAIEQITGSRDAAGIPRITVGIRNTGKRAVDISGTIGLSNGPGGLQTGLIRTDSTVTLAPGQSATTTAEFDQRLLPGPWHATVALASGLISRQATATVTFTAATAVVVRSTSHHSMWWLWLIVAAAAVAAAFAVVVLLRRSRIAQAPASHRRAG